MKSFAHFFNPFAWAALLAGTGCVQEASVSPDPALSSSIIAAGGAETDGPLIEASQEHFTVGITRVVSRLSPAQTDQADITFQVTNRSGTAVSFIAFGTEGLTRMAPGTGSIHSGTAGTYRVSYTDQSGNPGFESVKFESLPGEGFRHGASEYFTLTVEGYRPDYKFTVQAHAGKIRETFSGLSIQ